MSEDNPVWPRGWAGPRLSSRNLGGARKVWSQAASSYAKLDPVRPLTFYLVLLMFIPSTLIFAPLGGAGTPAIGFSLVLLLWYIASWSVGGIIPSGGGRAIRVAMLFFALVVLVSFVAATTRDITQVELLSADRGLLIVADWAGLIIVASQSISKYEQISAILRRAVLFGSVVAAIGIFEFYTHIDVTNLIHIPGLSVNSSVTVNIMYRNGLVRPSSTAVQPIEFGVVMAMLLPFALQQALDPSRTGRLRKWLPVGLIAYALPISVSRSGILAGVVAVVFLVPTWRPRQRRSFLVAIILGLMPLQLAAPGLIKTLGSYFGGVLGSAGSTSVVSRTSDYSRDWPYIQQRPIFGRGFGTFIPQLYSYTDNAYLHQLIECGIVGVVALAALYLVGMHCAVVGRKLTLDERRREAGQAFVASIAAAAVASATFDSLDFPMFTGILFLILGLVGAYLGAMRAEARALAALQGLGNNERFEEI